MNANRYVDSSRSLDAGSEAIWLLQIAPASLIARIVLCAVVVLGALSAGAAPFKPRYAALDTSRVLNPGDIIFTDSEAAVLRLDFVTKQTSVLAAGGLLVRPCGIALGPDNTIYVTDTGSLAVIAINPETEESTVISQGDQLGVPFGIAVSADGEIFVANGQTVVRINPADGTQRPMPSGILKAPLGVAVGPDGDLYVADAGGMVVRIDLRRGAQTIVTTGQNMVSPVGIVVRDHKTIYVSDPTTRRIIEVDSRNGAQIVVSAEVKLACPFGLALGGEGNLLVGDPDAFDFASGIISIDLLDGAQYPLATGNGNLVNFRCVAAVPAQ